MTFHVSHYDRLGELLSISFISTIVLDLDVEIERTLTPVHLLAVLVWTDVLSVDFFGSPPVMLLSAVAHAVLLVRFMGFQSQALQIAVFVNHRLHVAHI